MEGLVNIRGRPLNHDNIRYYNLKTSRLVKNVPVDAIVGVKYLVIGSVEELRQFANLNNLPYKDVIPEEYLKEEVEKITLATRSDDIEDISDKELSLLTEFSLMHLKAKAKVLTVIDGDTISAAVYIPMDFLSQQRSSKNSNYCFALPYRSNTGFLARFRCRLYGIDTAEKNTSGGVEIKNKLIELCHKTNNIVYIQFFDTDKYGRHLIRMFSDSKYQKSINNELMSHSNMTNEYYGGKKETFTESKQAKTSKFLNFFKSS